jgi:hypothetical protein
MESPSRISNLGTADEKRRGIEKPIVQGAVHEKGGFDRIVCDARGEL